MFIKGVDQLNLILLKLLVGNLESEELTKLNPRTHSQLLQLIQRNRMESVFYEYIKKRGLLNLFNKTQMKQLLFISNFQIINTKKHLKMVTEISKAFGQKINYVFLKGVALIAMNDSLKNRPIRDIDILVSEEHINEAVEILKSLGFCQQYKDSQKSEYDYPPMVNKSGVKVEIHYRIFRKNHMQRCILSASILKNKVRENFNNQDIFIPKVSDQICHFIYHASTKDYFNSGPYVISDLKNLRDISKLDTCQITNFSKKYKLEKHAYAFFDLIDHICINKKGSGQTPIHIISLITGLLFENTLNGEDVFLIENGMRRKRVFAFFAKLKNLGFIDQSKYMFSRFKRFLATFIKKYLNYRIYSNYKDFRKVKDYLES